MIHPELGTLFSDVKAQRNFHNRIFKQTNRNATFAINDICATSAINFYSQLERNATSETDFSY